MSEIDVNQALALSGGEEAMGLGDIDILNDSKGNAEQDLSKVDESESVVMDDTPGDQPGKVVPEAIHQELVTTLVTKRLLVRRRMKMVRSQGLTSTWTPS